VHYVRACRGVEVELHLFPASVEEIVMKVKFTLEHNAKAQMWSRSIALLFLYLSARSGWVVNTTSRPLYPREDPVLLV